MIGDSVFSEFDNPENCTKSAIDIQIRLKERNELCRKNDRIQIRIGLHYGQVVVKDDDLFGNDVNIIVYDLQGKIAAELVSGMKPAGHYTLKWDASDQASGIYFVKMMTEEFTKTQKLILVK